MKSISVVQLYSRAVFSERTSFVFTFSRDDHTHLRGGDGLLACDVSTRNFSGRVIQSDFAAKRRTRRHAEGTGFAKPNGKGVVGPDAQQPAGLEAEAAEIETCRG